MAFRINSRTLGSRIQRSLIPVPAEEACGLIGSAFADAVFTLQRTDEAAPPSDRPRLGVLLGEGDGAPRITRVVGASVAEAAGLKAGDQIVRAAGLETRHPTSSWRSSADKRPAPGCR